MAIYDLKNDSLTVQVNSLGAELCRIRDNYSDSEYLWSGEERYWKRFAPILFPIVGNVKDKKYTYKGKTYSLPQHGFARDMEFSLISRASDEIWFELKDDEFTRKVYPFEFSLKVGYRLTERTIETMWKVENTGDEDMYFSIGGHPGFYCPEPKKRQTDYYFAFDTAKNLIYDKLASSGLVASDSNIMPLNGSLLPITEHMFDEDALIFENNQAHRVSILHMDRSPYITVEFDAPVFGLWSPAKKNAPFICIEPWYGRADRADFEGTLEEREWGNHLAIGEIFEASYKIMV